MSITTVTLTGTFKDADGNVAAGTIEMTPCRPFSNAGSNIVVNTETITITLNGSGEIPASTTVYANDDTDTYPTGTWYDVVFKFTGAKERKDRFVITATDTVDFSDLVSVASPLPTANYASAATLIADYVAKAGGRMTGDLVMDQSVIGWDAAGGVDTFEVGGVEAVSAPTVYRWAVVDAINSRSVLSAVNGAAGLSYSQILDRLKVVKGSGQTANLLELTDTDGTTLLLSVDDDGTVRWGSTVTLSKNATNSHWLEAKPDAANTAAWLNVYGVAGSGTGPVVGTFQSRGTVASPSAVQSADVLGLFRTLGHDGTAFYTVTQIAGSAEEAFTGSAHGARMIFSTVAPGATTLSERMRLTGAGVLEVASTGTPGTVEKFRVNTPTTAVNTANALFSAGAAADIPVVVEGAGSQSASLIEGKTSTGSTVWSVGATGIETAVALVPSGLTGAVSASRYVGATALVAPTTGTFAVGDWVVTQSGRVFVCVTAGTPGSWVDVGDDTQITSGETSMRRDDATSTAITLSTGVLRLRYFTARKTETITSVSMISGTAAGATPTLCRIGVYSVASDGALTLVASCANDTALFAGATTEYTRSLSASLSKVAGTRYAIGALVVTGASAPTCYGALVPSAVSGVAPRISGLVSGQTDLPASVAAGSIGDSSHGPYVRLIP